MPTEKELFSKLGWSIWQATEWFNAGKCLEEDLPTAADLARQYNWRLETVKKKLRKLKEQGLIRAVTVSPKRYCFDTWALKSLDDAHPLYELFCEPHSPHYIQSL